MHHRWEDPGVHRVSAPRQAVGAARGEGAASAVKHPGRVRLNEGLDEGEPWPTPSEGVA